MQGGAARRELPVAGVTGAEAGVPGDLVFAEEGQALVQIGSAVLQM